MAALALATAALALAGVRVLAPRLALPAPAFVIAVVVALVPLLAAAARVDAYHPHARLGAANLITAVRLALAAILAALLPASITGATAWVIVSLVFVFAALDGVDGWLARRAGCGSAFGARFDMETDAFGILVLCVLVWLHGKAGVWVIACGLLRYAFVAAGWVWPWMSAPLTPTLRGRAVAVLQFIGLALAISPIVEPGTSHVIAAATLAALTYSFAADVARLAPDS